MPVGVYSAIFALFALSTLASGLYLVLRANTVAKIVERPDNDVVSADTRRPGERRRRARTRIAGAIFLLGSLGLVVLIGLYASDAVPLDGMKTDVTVQRP